MDDSRFDDPIRGRQQRGSRRGALVALVAGPSLPTLATPGAEAARTPCNDGNPCTTEDIGNFQGVCEGTPVTVAC